MSEYEDLYWNDLTCVFLELNLVLLETLKSNT